MLGRTVPGRRAAAPAVALATVVLTPAAAAGSVDPSGVVDEPVARVTVACAQSSARPSEATRAAMRRAVRCLVNAHRRAAGLRPLHAVDSLTRAAQRHARDMVRRGYFAHQRAGGPGLMARARAAGFRGSRVGEAIAWGCGTLATPATTVGNWLASPPHRAILLSGRYGRVGVGVMRRAPGGCRGGTWVLDVGGG